MTEIIVYRNPVEASFYQNFGPIALFVGLTILLMFVFDFIINKIWKGWNKPKHIHNIALVVSIVLSGLAVVLINT